MMQKPRDPKTLSKEALADIVRRMQYWLFYSENDYGVPAWDLETSVDLADTVTHMGDVLSEYDLLPRAPGPKDWFPKK